MSADGEPPGTLNYGPAGAPSAARTALGTGAGHLLAFSVAVLGGVLGVIGAFVQEARAGDLLLLPFIGAPIIEELLKPAGVYILLVRWPQLLRGQLHTALLTAVSGLSFGLIEAVVYVTVYVPDHSDAFLLYRFTLPLAVHTTASFIVGLGINRSLLDWAREGAPFPKATRNFFIVGIVLHAAFNTIAAALAISGVLDV